MTILTFWRTKTINLSRIITIAPRGGTSCKALKGNPARYPPTGWNTGRLPWKENRFIDLLLNSDGTSETEHAIRLVVERKLLLPPFDGGLKDSKRRMKVVLYTS